MTISEIMIILIIIAYFEDIMLCVKLSNFLNAFLFKLKILQKKVLLLSSLCLQEY